MKQNIPMEKILREYRVNKQRISFLENQIRRMTPELDKDYIESKMFARGHSDKTLKLAIVKGEEVAVLNNVEETADNYRLHCENEYREAINCLRNEIFRLHNAVYIVEDSLDALGESNEKYRTLLEKYYLQGESMEEIAEILHLSRSRCYELCKKAVEYMEMVVFGTSSINQENVF